MKSTRRWQQLLLNSLAIILGNALYSLAVALFLEPAGLITGGATGIALAFGRLTGLSVSGFLFLFNMSMLVWGWAVLGKKFALNTLASSVLSPAFLGLFERLLDGRVLTEDIFLCTIFSGLGIGVALGMVIRAGASTGGMDIPPLVLQKWFRWPVSITMMLFDIAILLVQAAFSQPEQVLYGIVLVITHTIVMDKMLMLGDSRTEVKIISTRSDEIRTAILAEIDRGDLLPAGSLHRNACSGPLPCDPDLSGRSLCFLLRPGSRSCSAGLPECRLQCLCAAVQCLPELSGGGGLYQCLC